jgi:tape measure domain-containing protein
MTSLGNATAGMGTGSEGIKRATVALQQMQAAGKITGEDLNQLRDAGIPVFDLLSAATGKTKEEISALAQKGKLGKKEMLQLFAALESGKGLERFSGLMAKQSDTLAGQFSTLKDTINMGLAGAVKPLIPLLKDGLGAASTFLSNTALPKLTAGIALAAKWMSVVQQSFKGAVTDTSGLSDGMSLLAIRFGYIARTAGPFLRTIRDVMQGGAKDTSGMNHEVALLAISIGAKLRNAIDKVKSVATALAPVKDAIAGAFSSMKAGDASAAGASLGSMADSAGKLAPLVKDLAAMVPSLNDVLAVSATVLRVAADNTDTLAKILPLLAAGYIAVKVGQLAANVAQAASLPMKIVELRVNQQLNASNRALIASRSQLTAATTTGTAAENTGILAKARGTVVTLAKSAAEKAAALATRSMAAAQWLMNAAMSANPIGLIILALVALGAAVVIAWKKSETFRNIVLGAWAAIRGGVSAVVGWLKTAVPAVFSWIKSAFLRFTPLGLVISHWSQIRAFIAAAVNGVKATIGWFGSLPGKFRSWFGSAKTAATGQLGSLLSWVKGLPGKVTGALGNLGSLLTDKGSEIVNGLISGIRNMGGRLAGFVKQFVADHIPGPVAKALGIASPSKVTAEQGRWTAKGLVVGMLSQAKHVKAASMRLAEAAVSPMTLAPAGVSLATGGASMLTPNALAAGRASGAVDATGAGRPIEMKIYPQQGQSEQEIGAAAANSLAFRMKLA